MKRKIYAIMVLFVVLVYPSRVFAQGGGGMIWGTSAPSIPELNSSGMRAGDLCMHGGYGYGVTNNGLKIGGFGFSYADDASQVASGGFGGLLLGTYNNLKLFTLSTNVLIGFGALEWTAAQSQRSGGIMLGQVDAEIGIPIVSWFQLSAYGGMQVLLPVEAAVQDIVYLPVMGVRLTWGAF